MRSATLKIDLAVYERDAPRQETSIVLTAWCGTRIIGQLLDTVEEPAEQVVDLLTRLLCSGVCSIIADLADDLAAGDPGCTVVLAEPVSPQ